MEESTRTTILTSNSELCLVGLTRDDSNAYYALVDRNRVHLMQHGDYLDLGEATPDSVVADLSEVGEGESRFGIWLGDRLIGRADLNARTPVDFVLGYWLGGDHTGKGYATLACRALIEHGRTVLGAKNIYAGVTKGNTTSEAVIGRLGFQAVSDQGTYTRFKLELE